MFRSITNLGDYNDNAKDFPPSETDVTAYEPLETTIKRFERTGGVPQFLGEYDVTADMPIDEAFEKEDITMAPGFDLADITEIEERGKEALCQVAGLQGKTAEQSATKPESKTGDVASNTTEPVEA